MTVLGVASVVAGVVLTGGASLQANPEQTLKAGFAFIVPGFVGIVTGAVLWVFNGSSVVNDTRASR